MLKRTLAYVKKTPWLYRTSLVLVALALPFFWMGVAMVELWKSEPLTTVYAALWKAFKKGASL